MKARADSRLLWQAFEQAARSHGDAVALTDGVTSVSYDRLRARAGRCAHRLHNSEPGRRALERDGTVVALVASEPASTVAWILGALSTGASVAPIAPEGRDRDEQVRLLQPDVTVTCTGDGVIRRPVLPGRVGRLAPPPPGMVICTAGTTGTPKAVAHSHQTLGHAVRRLQLFRAESLGVVERVPRDDVELETDILAAAAAPPRGRPYL
jgi:acyl-CoA synthetase (AMP-forming)/AMP-acid ligase II